MIRFSLRPWGDVQAYTSPISAWGFAAVAGESKWSEARTVVARAVDSSNAASAAESAGFSALDGLVSPVETFILNTFNRCRYKLHAAPGWHHARRANALARKYRSIPMYWIAYERAVSTKVQWTDSLGVAHPSFPVTNFRFSRRCAKSYEVGKENSTDIELYLRIMVGNPVVLIHGCPLSGASWPTAIIRIAVRRTDRRTFLPVTNQPDKTMFHPTNRMQP